MKGYIIKIRELLRISNTAIILSPIKNYCLKINDKQSLYFI